MMANILQQNDEDIVCLAQAGSLEAFTVLYERYLPIVHRRVQYVIPQEDVEDVTQEIFISMMRSLKSFRGESRFCTWLRTLVNRQVADFYRRRKPAHVALEGEGEMDDSGRYLKAVDANLVTQSHTTLVEDNLVLRQALGRLPGKYQEVLMLRFADDLQFDEIAHAQGQSLEATKSLFRRAIAALQKVMEECNA